MASIEFTVRTNGRGLREITPDVNDAAHRLMDRGASPEGLCTVFVRHTSCSLTIQENADPSAKLDLERWLDRLVPEHDALYTHTSEGPDDMPAHIKAALTATSLGVPMLDGRLSLGTWQGVYLWEHRRARHERRVVVNVVG